MSGKEVAPCRPSAHEAHRDDRAAPSREEHREEASEGDSTLASYRTQLATLDMRCRILHAELEESRRLQQGAVSASSTAQVRVQTSPHTPHPNPTLTQVVAARRSPSLHSMWQWSEVGLLNHGRGWCTADIYSPRCSP